MADDSGKPSKSSAPAPPAAAASDSALARDGGGSRGRSSSSRGQSGGRGRTTVIRAASSPDDPGREGVRLGVTTFTTAASFVGLLALGAIASRIGADGWLGVGPLRRSLAETFVTGVRMPLVMLESLYESGVANPLFFAAAMVLLIPPIAALAAARPANPGGRRPEGAILAAGRVAAALVIVADIGIGIRLSRSTRPTFADAGVDPAWLDDLRSLAAADGITMVFAILVAVLVFRIPVDRWARRLAGTIAIATAVAATVGSAASSGIIAAVESPRPIVIAVDTPLTPDSDRILIGTTEDGRDVLLGADDPTVRALVAPTSHVVVGTTSIAEAFGADG